MNKHKPTIFLDMDGVLCDWTSAVCRLFDREPQLVHRTWREKTKSSDIAKALDLTYEELWDGVNAAGFSFWEGLEPFTWTGDLLSLCKKYADTVILTSPSRDPMSAAGKIAWMQKHIPDWKSQEYLIGGPKHLCARPNAILIDDRLSNIDKFFAHGGGTSLFPQYWNCDMRSYSDPVKKTREDLDIFFGHYAIVD